MKKTALIASIALMLATGCANRRPLPVAPPFPEAEYDALAKTGTGVVKGQVFMKTNGGDVKKGAGESVRLRPNTSYAARLSAMGPQVSGVNYKMTEFDRSVTSDGEGRFEFKDVPPGSYLVTSKVTWTVYTPGILTPIANVQGGSITKTATAEDGKTVEVMLTR